MKIKIIVLSLFMFLTYNLNAKVYNFKSYQMYQCYFNDNKIVINEKPFEYIIKISIDLDNKYIEFTGEDYNLYTIFKIEKYKYQDVSIYSIYCEDMNKIRCILKIYKYNINEYVLCVEYSDI